jgi:hypothetical protein
VYENQPVNKPEMKNDEIRIAVQQHFKIIDKLFRKIIIDFATEDIREFRREIKKLRSFLRLLNFESSSEYPLRITKKLKTFYGYIGIIRNLQLNLKNIDGYYKSATGRIPGSYIRKIEREIQYWKANTKTFMDVDSNFYNDEEIMLTELPDKLTKTSVQRFLQYVFHELDVLAKHSDDDEVLHSIRKLIQDIVYNLPYIHNFKLTVPIGFDDEKTLLCIELLETFRDRCVELVLLKTYYDDDYSIEEKRLLEQIGKILQEEKQQIKCEIYSSLNSLQLTPEKIKSVSFSQAACH